MDRFIELAAFVRTVDRGSQAAAARELGVTPAMVGRYIRALEDRLGVRLLNRTTATQSLTEAGTLFHTRATAVLDDLEAAEDAVTDRQAAPHGMLRVAAPMVFGTRHLAGWLAGFGALYPGVRLQLTLNDRVVDLVEEGYDVALRIGQLEDSSLVARRLAPCRVVLCAAPGYLARRGTPDTPDELRAHDCLLYSYSATGSLWRLIGPGGRTAAIEVDGALIANNGEALCAAAIEAPASSCNRPSSSATRFATAASSASCPPGASPTSRSPPSTPPPATSRPRSAPSSTSSPPASPKLSPGTKTSLNPAPGTGRSTPRALSEPLGSEVVLYSIVLAGITSDRVIPPDRKML